MSELGPELIVRIKPSNFSPKKSATYVKNPYIIPLFDLLKKPVCTSIEADDAITFSIPLTDGLFVTANAYKFDFDFQSKFLVLGGDMKRVVTIPEYLYKALDMYERMGTNLTYDISYLPYGNIAICKFCNREETVEMGSTEGFWKFVKSLDNIRKGYVADFFKIGDYKEVVLS